jgi:multidrug efflux pump subunit AcrB
MISMPVYIGLLMLMGIVTKNAIMLVDFAIEETPAASSAAGETSSAAGRNRRDRSL